MGDFVVRVPGSSANLGAGFDVLGMALTVHAEVGIGAPPPGARVADEHHPAAIAFGELGGIGPVWTRSNIPMGRGLGYSGAVRVGGAAVAIVQRHGPDAITSPAHRRDILAVATRLERHGDNAAASLEGGVVIAVDGVVTPVELALDPAVVAWIPDRTSTSTDRSRTTLPDSVARADAVFNLGRVATFVAACSAGNVELLRLATEDRLHQPQRLAAVPAAAAAIDAGLAAGAWAAWLSGSGPTVAMWCEPGRADEIVAALPVDGHAKVLGIDRAGVVVAPVSGE